MNDLIDRSALELSNLIANGTVTPPQVLEAFIDRIRAVNPDTNALVVKNFDRARRLAREQYKQRDDRTNPPLFYGVPVSIKEMISLKDSPITCGSVYREDAEATQDADAVREIKEAGAIPVGQTNVPELGLWIESTNPVYGTTSNPHDHDRTSGGSSGGEAALIATGGSPIGIGSDMGGSIRIPSSFCGIYGHKPSTTSVSAEGHFPQEFSPARMDFVPRTNLVSVGPMTRHATDLLPLYNVLRSDSESPDNIPSKAENIVDFSNLTVYTLPDPDISMASAASDDVKESVETAGRILSDRGATIESFPRTFFQDATRIYLSYLESEGLPHVGKMAGSGDQIEVTGELAKKLLSRGNHTMPMLTLCLIDSVFSPSQNALDRAVYKTQKLRDRLSGYLNPENLLLMPTFPSAAPAHGRTLLKPFDLIYAAIFNILDFPVTSAPVSYNENELPLGIQLVAPMGGDEISIGAAMALEEALGTPDIVPD